MATDLHTMSTGPVAATTPTAWVRSDPGSISPFIIILLPALVGLAGLAFDGGNLFTARREARNVASAAARAGANDILESSIYAGDPQLAPTASATAVTFAFAQGADAATASQVANDLIEVRVTRTVEMEFMDLFGIDAATVTGESQARVRDAVVGP
jgi:Flp pilus assembly protein TadG